MGNAIIKHCGTILSFAASIALSESGMGMRTGTGLTLLLSLLLCGCERKAADCAAPLETRIDNLAGMAERQLKQAEMREFLWSHWRGKQCATLLLEAISKEGMETDSSFEIKVLPVGTTVMVVTIKRATYGYQEQVFWHEVAKDEIYTVERVQPSNPYLLNEDSKVAVLPDSSNLSGSDYCLRFKGWGNELVSFF